MFSNIYNIHSSSNTETIFHIHTKWNQTQKSRGRFSPGFTVVSFSWKLHEPEINSGGAKKMMQIYFYMLHS